MTGNEILTFAKKRVKNFTASIDWESLFAITIDDIFTRKQWKFAQGELNYIHPQSTFEKEFNDNPIELALNKIKSIRYTTSYIVVLGVPVPASNTSYALKFEPMQRFMDLYPDQVQDGTPYLYTELRGNDGTRGMQIGIYPRPSSDTAVWIEGDFIPSYSIDDDPLPILPVQFHRLVGFGIVMHAADEAEQPKLSAKAERWYEQGIERMDTWDIKNQNYLARRIGINEGGRATHGPYLPGEYPRGFGR